MYVIKPVYLRPCKWTGMILNYSLLWEIFAISLTWYWISKNARSSDTPTFAVHVEGITTELTAEPVNAGFLSVTRSIQAAERLGNFVPLPTNTNAKNTNNYKNTGFIIYRNTFISHASKDGTQNTACHYISQRGPNNQRCGCKSPQFWVCQ